MKKTILENNNQKYACLYWKGKKNNDVAFVYYHGLNGKAKIIKPLLNEINDYDVYSIEQRGHENSFQKASTKPKKHINDIKNVVEILKKKYKNVFLCGESMGALYTSLYAYKYGNVDGVFCWSIPFSPKDIMKEKKVSKAKIIFKLFLTFLFGLDYRYSARIDYPKLTNSKFLIKLNEFDLDTKGSTAEEVSIWKGSLVIKNKFLNKKPLTPIYYWQGSDDIMSNNLILKKIQKKGNVFAEEIKDGRHILMFEKNSKHMYQKIIDVIETNLGKNS